MTSHSSQPASAADFPYSSGISWGRFGVFRLPPGADLIAALHAFQRHSGAAAISVVTCVGSLTRVLIRHANTPAGTLYEGHFEITSLTGTIDPDGEHLHLTITDGEGRAFGGHLLAESAVYTTAEITVLLLDDLVFTREPCALSGYDELVIHPATDGTHAHRPNPEEPSQ
ncbi:PPC domain-containing DNA-binding protein [Gemmobacter sp. 24YEA27]|uniref:PPC domain-containing DNA-binding protein n=1 Tax=Gemmobacter sp. 24YEA27 TaxID=3040672 RepID=UPI0024B388F1|nr:PPC domain-containing DNA-binding protein [Gemmobacter sp. 24YEA27]